MSKTDDVLFADVELSIHVPLGEFDLPNGQHVTNVDSKTLLPGEFVALADLPAYQREAAKQGKITGGRVVSLETAKVLSDEAARFRNVEEDVDLSHSDFEVSDEERAANHANLADEAVDEPDVEPEVEEVQPEAPEAEVAPEEEVKEAKK